MVGKAYTLKELKRIVEYLVEHKLYGDLKGRKMWMDFANTGKLDRTWQSLKETFHKRILPDIHNPYYKLTVQQISSFRSGSNVEDPNIVKLVVHASDSNSNGDIEAVIEQPSTSKTDGEMGSKGKEVQCSKVRSNKSSTETLVLDTLETVEDAQNDSDERDRTHTALRDLIIYSEPLTPMLQEVLDDFATDDDEPRMQIVEDDELEPNKQTSDVVSVSPSPIRKSCSFNLDRAYLITDKAVSPAKKKSDKIKPVKLIKTRSGAWESKEENVVQINNSKDDSVVLNKATDSVITVDSSEQQNSSDVVQNTQNKTYENTNNDTPDSLLPNNPEALNTSKNNHESAVSCPIDNVKESQGIKRRGDTQSQAEPKKKLRGGKEIPDDVNQDTEINAESENNNDKTANKVTSANDTSENVKENSKSNDLEAKEDNEDPDTNPCLKSVSLYEEQFSQSKYSDSEPDNQVTTTAEVNRNTKSVVDSPKKSKDSTNQESKETEKKMEESQDDNAKNTKQVVKVIQEKTMKEKLDDIVITSDSDSHSGKVGKMSTSRVDRRKVLANVFGFSSGNVFRKRTLSLRDKTKRRYSQRRRLNTHTIFNTVKSSGSTDYSSLTDTDDINLPSPGKRQCHTDDKYMNPKPLNIMKCPGGGGLFVMDGNKLYPIVKHDKHVKNFLRCHDESDSETESFWKAKYLEEKRKTERLTKQNTNSLAQKNADSVSRATSPMNIANNDGEKTVALRAPSESGKESVLDENNGLSDKKVKIKIAKNYESVELECQSGQVYDILEKMKLIMGKRSSDDNNTELNAPLVLSSGKSTPVPQVPIDPDVHARVNKIESEIFQEIVERDKIEENINKKRRGRPRKPSTNSVSNASDRSKSPKEPTEIPSIPLPPPPTESTPAIEVEPTKDKGVVAKRKVRTLKKVDPELVENIRTSTRLSSLSASNVKNQVVIPEADSQVLYKFPASAPASRSNSRTRRNNQQAKYTAKISTDLQSPNESSLGYQDTDISSVNIELRRKRKSTNHQYKGKHVRSNIRRKSDPYHGDDDTCEVKSFSASNNAIKEPNSTLDPEVYGSESYQLLMPNPRIVEHLDKIDELISTNGSKSIIIKSDSLSPNTINITVLDKNKGSSPRTEDNSSNISFPRSPELSVVENISISKSVLSSVDENPPSINELQANGSFEVTDLNKYLLSHIDVSVPLMEQKCYFATTEQNNFTDAQRKSFVSESLLDKINTVNVDEPSSSDSLDQKLRDLLLESAKKMSHTNFDYTDPNKMEVDTTVAKDTQTKRSKKRSSTPCKKRVTKKSKATKIDPLIEEHTESCSRKSRNSCPAMINVADKENNDVSTTDLNKKVRGKKDVIKVKIQKPRNTKEKRAKSTSRMSMCTDSGINDTESGVFLQGVEDSIDVELIHNHSDTCLHANECFGDSVEFIDNGVNSIISIDSTPRKSADSSQIAIQNEGLDHDDRTPEFFCNNAQDATSLKGVKEQSSKVTDSTGEGTVYHTPNSNDSFDSLVTDDLSDEPPPPAVPTHKPSKWYIWSEDDTNADYQDAICRDSVSVGSNLHQIFPITCAIPNLSTITENSTDSRKVIDSDVANTESRPLPSSQSIFDI